ncbi:hypothetical protein QE152_g41628 [Popillia japonica]|uniref:DDE-1 domain-containing protein n=1 Tax=Popillia japonica TaxID=7064 RepID=A0AAW1GEU9_POPJA
MRRVKKHLPYKGKFVWDQWVAGPHAHGDVPEGKIVYAASTKGWMEKEIFNNYFEKSFLINGLQVHMLMEMFLKEKLCMQRAPRGGWKRKSSTTILKNRFYQ